MKPFFRNILAVGIAVFGVNGVWAALELDACYGDHMVLQHGRPVVISGTSDSAKAIQGLKSLASSLRNIKGVVESGLKLDKLVADLDQMKTKFATTFDTDTVNNINKVADALEGLSNSANVKLPNISMGIDTEAVTPQATSVDSPVVIAKPDLSALDEANNELEVKLNALKDKLALDELDIQWDPTVDRLTTVALGGLAKGTNLKGKTLREILT